jgi:hypothetical protein
MLLHALHDPTTTGLRVRAKLRDIRLAGLTDRSAMAAARLTRGGLRVADAKDRSRDQQRRASENPMFHMLLSYRRRAHR